LGSMTGSQSQQSHNQGEHILTPEIKKHLSGINQSLHLYEDDLAQSVHPEHPTFQSLPSPMPHLVRELCKVKREIITGARYVGTKLEQIETSMVQVEEGTKGLQEALKRVRMRMDWQDTHQTQHEGVTSHLHQSIQSEQGLANGGDEQLP